MNAFPDNPEPRPIGRSQDEQIGDSSPPVQSELPLAHGPAEVASGDAGSPTLASEPPRDPAWSALDVLRLTLIALVAMVASTCAVLAGAHFLVLPQTPLGGLARFPLVAVAGEALGYVLVLAYMYVLVTRECGRADFLEALHWNWPKVIAPYLAGGVVLALALQLLAHLLPMPKNLPIDTFFQTPAEAWVLSVFSISFAPLMEELFFRGFLYPVLRRGIGVTAAIFATAFAFALLHGAQLMFSWGPVLVIALVGVVLTMVRAYKDSVAAGLLIHVAYNGTISAMMFVGTDGFRHLDKLNQ